MGLGENMSKHRKSCRLKEYNYSSWGYYFVTICTKDRIDCFGEIKDGLMILNQYGEIAKTKWVEIPQHFDCVQLDQFVVMSNHVHGIIIINSDINNVGNRHACSLQEQRKYQRLPVIVGAYKAAVSKLIRQLTHEGWNFQWQKSYYDHIIRHERSLNNIREYINQNVSQGSGMP